MSSQPVTVLVSQDSFLIQRELDPLINANLKKEERDFNLDRYSSRQGDTSNIINSCYQLPVMASCRVVIVADADSFKKEELDLWMPYFENPSISTKLILIASKIDKRLKLWQFANKKGWIQEVKLPYMNQLPPWIEREAKALGLSISCKAAQAMSDSIGLLLHAQIQALQKLEIFIHPRKNIELKDVEQVVGDFLSKTVFDLVDKVGQQDFKQAQALLDQMSTQGEPFVRILFMIIRHFRMLMMSHEGFSKSWSEKEWVQKLGVHPFFVKDYQTQAKKISHQKLQSIYQHLLETDRSLKRSPLNSRFIVDRFLMEVCLT